VSPIVRFLLIFVAYLLVARACLALANYRLRTLLFGLTNVVVIAFLFDWSAGRGRAIAFYFVYIALVSVLYLTVRIFAKRRSGSWVALLSPIIALIVLRYVPFFWDAIWRLLHVKPDVPIAVFFIGISFMAFRLSHLALEVKNKLVPMPSWDEYIGFAFFIPTLAVGPINPYSGHHRSLNELDRTVTPIGRSVQRIIVGAVKYQFLAGLFNQLSYTGLILDGHPHTVADLAIASIAYYLYIYCNFSGFCDMAIGTAGLLGIYIRENFKFPLAANSVKDYWNRWHITLSEYMRDMVFWRLSKNLTKRMGSRNSNDAIALSITVVFLLVGVWHGLGWQYVAFGVMHAAGVVSHHYYTMWLRKKIGPAKYKAYNDNRLIEALSVALTFIFVTASMFFFANDITTARQILAAIR